MTRTYKGANTMQKTFAVLAALAVSAPAFAGDIMVGPAKLDPSYGFESRYEDNIYRVPRDENHTAVSGGGVRGSWIFINSLGLKASAPVAENQKVSLGYGAVIESYKTQPKANNAVNQTANAAWDYSGSKIKAKLHDEYVNTHDPAFNPNGTVLNGALVEREARWQNVGGAEVQYYLGDKFYAGVDGSDTVNRYLDRNGGPASLANLLNTSVVYFGAKAGYQVAPKTSVFVAEHRSVTHYTEHTRFDNHRDWLTDVGVEGELTAKLKGLVKTGWIYQQFDYDPTNPTRKTVGRTWSFLAALDYRPVEYGQIVLTANRGVADAATNGSRYYSTTGFSLAYNHVFTEKISGGVNGGAQWDKYSDDFTVGTFTHSRRDDSYQVGAKADYKVTDWATTGLTFTHNSRFSTFSRQYNYKDNITGWNVKLAF
jgi:hypothetical protein